MGRWGDGSVVQYHRGKVNLLLRQAGHAPAATDFIAFVRGAPAATEATARRDRSIGLSASRPSETGPR
ncbi:MAG: DinB family protein [Acidobacteriota bacterium]